MGRKKPSSSSDIEPLNPCDASRRDFLKGAGTMAAGFMATPLGKAEEAKTLPTVPLGPHRVTRMIVGSNPIRGYSHFNHQYNRHMVEWYTDERAAQVLLDCQKAGINTFQSSYYPPRLLRHFELLHKLGGHLQWICLTSPGDVIPQMENQTPEWLRDGQITAIDTVVKLKPIGMAHHGSDTDFLWRAGKIDYLKTYINKVHDVGCLAGISTHNPAMLEALESKGWPVDFYMTALYYLTRTDEDFKKEIGMVPVGETYFAEDPPRMCEVIRKVKKPCLAYKILAAGRKCNSPREVRETFAWTFKNIKPTDAVIVGLYPRFSDQITEDTQTVRQICG
jgi:hypothetical protein